MSSLTYEYQAGGSLSLTASSYIKRQADDDFYQGLKQGKFCYVLNARQSNVGPFSTQYSRKIFWLETFKVLKTSKVFAPKIFLENYIIRL
jgi:hypothetical protein